MRKIIALTGQAGAGKDTIADIILKNSHSYKTGWARMSFADHLKGVVAKLFFMDRIMLEGITPEDRKKREEPDPFWSEKMGKPFTPRHALQFVGTELLRNQLHKNIWVDCLEKKIDQTTCNICITDVRFRNEIDMLRRKGATFVRIEFANKPYYWDTVYKNNLCEQLDPDEQRKLKEINECIHLSERDWIGIDNPEYIFTHRDTKEQLEEDILNSEFWRKVIEDNE